MWEPSNAEASQQAAQVRRATKPEALADAIKAFDGAWRGDPVSDYPLEIVAALGRLDTLPAGEFWRPIAKHSPPRGKPPFPSLALCCRVVCRARSTRAAVDCGIVRARYMPLVFAATGTMVEPVVGVIAKPMGADVAAQFQVSPREVDQAFALTIRELLDPELAFKEILEYDVRRVRGIPAAEGEAPGEMNKMAVPVFMGGPARVWGVTAMILDNFLDKVVVPALAKDGQPRTRHELKVRHKDK